jgi:hypothetical protein
MRKSQSVLRPSEETSIWISRQFYAVLCPIPCLQMFVYNRHNSTVCGGRGSLAQEIDILLFLDSLTVPT